MKAEVRGELLRMLSILPIVNTSQIARCLFKNSGSPGKRSSEALKELEQEKLIEGRRLGDMSRVWRLTRQGRTETETPRKLISLTSSKLKHYLAIGDLYVMLRENGGLKYFEVEPREKYKRIGHEYVFAPDALYVEGKSVYLAEMQLSRMDRKGWAKKWKRANEYFNDRHFEGASWQRWKKGDFIKPYFVAFSDQSADVVKSGFDVNDRELEVRLLSLK